MAKIIGELIIEKHELHPENTVRRPRGNEYIVVPEENDTIDTIIQTVIDAIDQIAPYVRNCPTGSWTGRATTYLTIQPIKGERRDELANRIFKEARHSGLCMMRESDFDGRVQLILYTPNPDDPIMPAGFTSGFKDSRRNHYNINGYFDRMGATDD
jgi:uncharacterized protein YlzI (FlbEa/FlbD family)